MVTTVYMHFHGLALYKLNSCIAVTYCITLYDDNKLCRNAVLVPFNGLFIILSLALNISVHLNLFIVTKWITVYSGTSKSCLVTMWQASSHGSINRVSTNIDTPTVTSRAITLHFLITAICCTLRYKASDNRVLWFFIQWVGAKGFKSLFLTLGKACTRNLTVCYSMKKIPQKKLSMM